MKYCLAIVTFFVSLSVFAASKVQTIHSGSEFSLAAKEEALFFRNEYSVPQVVVVLGKYKAIIKGLPTRVSPNQLFTKSPQSCLNAKGITYCPGDKIMAANGAPEVFTIAGIQVSPEGFFKRQNKIAVEYRKSFAVVSAEQIVPLD